jgi:hypothetical protein
MIRRSAPALPCLAVLPVAARLSTAASNFRVDEDATRPALKVSYERTEAEVGQPISCRVEASRGAGDGMLLAEVGLPPGAEVDRASLERARPHRPLTRLRLLQPRSPRRRPPDEVRDTMKRSRQ